MSRAKKDPYSVSPFQCMRCGNCCRGEGYVNIGEEECRRMADYLEMPLEKFKSVYTLQMAGYQRWLVDGEGDDRPCVFLVKEGDDLCSCRVQAVKPDQCRDFPSKWRRADAKNWCRGIIGDKARKGDGS